MLPITLLPGLACDPELWRGQLAALAPAYLAMIERAGAAQRARRTAPSWRAPTSGHGRASAARRQGSSDETTR